MPWQVLNTKVKHIIGSMQNRNKIGELGEPIWLSGERAGEARK